MKITLDGKNYSLMGGLNISLYPQWATQIRTSGTMQRGDKAPFPQWEFGMTGGLGLRFWDADQPTRFYFSTCNTLWGRILLPLKRNLATGTVFTPVAVSDGGKSYFVGKTADNKLRISEWTGTGFTTVASYTLDVGDITIMGACLSSGSGGNEFRIYYYYWSGGNPVPYSITYDVLTATWGTPTADPVGLTTLGSKYRGVFAPSFTFSSGAMLGFLEKFSGGASFNQSFMVELGNPIGFVSTQTVTPTAVLVPGRPYLTVAGVTSYFASPEGAWAVTEKIGQQVVDLRGVAHPSNTKQMCWWNGRVIVPVKGGRIIAYNPSDATTSEIGLNRDDGLPPDYAGDITALYGYPGFLFAAVKGAKYNGVYAWDGAGWHTITTFPEGHDAIICISSSAAGGIPTLLLFSESGPVYYIQNFHANPLEIAGVGFESEGYIDYPAFGGPLGELLGAFYSVQCHGEWEMGQSGYVAPTYSVDLEPDEYASHASYPAWLQNPSVVGKLGVGKGIEGSYLKLRLRLLGQVATLSPVVLGPVVSYIKHGDQLLLYNFTIDTLATAKEWNQTQDAVLEELLRMAQSRLLTKLVVGTSTVMVYFRDMGLREEIMDGSASGIVQMKAVQAFR